MEWENWGSRREASRSAGGDLTCGWLTLKPLAQLFKNIPLFIHSNMHTLCPVLGQVMLKTWWWLRRLLLCPQSTVGLTVLCVCMYVRAHVCVWERPIPRRWWYRVITNAGLEEPQDPGEPEGMPYSAREAGRTSWRRDVALRPRVGGGMGWDGLGKGIPGSVNSIGKRHGGWDSLRGALRSQQNPGRMEGRAGRRCVLRGEAGEV